MQDQMLQRRLLTVNELIERGTVPAVEARS